MSRPRRDFTEAELTAIADRALAFSHLVARIGEDGKTPIPSLSSTARRSPISRWRLVWCCAPRSVKG